MKFVKCVNPLPINLTYQKIYEVIRHWTSDWSKLTYHVIINDVGVESTYEFQPLTDKWFEDATAEIRQNKLEQLGI